MATTGDNVYGEIVNIKNAYYALVTADSAAAYTPAANAYLAPTGEVTYDSKPTISQRAYDGRVMYAHVNEGEAEHKILISGVPLSTAAILTGKPYDSALGILLNTGELQDTPWCALSYQMEFGDSADNNRFVQFLKGKFLLSGYNAKTKGITVDPQTCDLMYYPVVTQYQWTMPDASTRGLKGVEGDTTDAAFTETAATWFASVQTPLTVGTAPAAIALSSSVPIDNATGVLVTATPTLTFNNVLYDYDGISLIDAVASTPKANTMTIDAAGKVITITPTTSFTAATEYYIVISGVTDIYGQTLATTVISFTTAA